MTRYLTVVAALGSVLTIGASSAAAKPVEKVALTAKYLSTDSKTKTGGLSIRTAFTIQDETGGPPEQLTRVVLRFPKGAVLNGRAFPSCAISKLTAGGVTGCPSKSKLGTGTATAAAAPIVPKVNAVVTLFNGPAAGANQSIVIYAIPDIGPNLALQATVKKGGGTPYGYILDDPVPPIQTLPGAPDASVTGFDATVKPKPAKQGKRKVPYLRGPLLCSGTFFLLDGAFSYKSGLTNTVYERFTLNGGPRCP